MENYFAVLNKINVNKDTKKINGLTYIPWSTAWNEVKKLDPTANFTVYEAADGCMYHTDGRTAWLKVGVTVFGLEHIEYLAITDYKNKSIPVESVKSTDAVNTMQRAITKACARHGLGLYIYAGDGLPEEEVKAKYKPNVYPENQVDINEDEIPF